MKPHDNPLKISGFFFNVLKRHRYAEFDEFGNPKLYLTNLRRNETVQSVSAWFVIGDPSVKLFLGELRQQLEVNEIASLVDRPESQIDADRSDDFKRFGRKA